jgi:ubiquinone/menaquinone biosynthesis C-methylase UbiE
MEVYQEKMYKHFSEIAPAYRTVRITDLEPIQIISQKLNDLTTVKAADVGCGDGRYSLLLFEYLNNLYLTCIDSNEEMLKQASSYLKGHGKYNFTTIKANANDLPVKCAPIDSIFSFNAVHHFNFQQFVERAATITKEGGLIFIYTRLPSQNSRNIWGRYFPLFAEKENRLYEIDEIKEIVDMMRCVDIESIKNFQFKRTATLECLVEKVKTRHYSTFSLYEEDELEEALKTFQENICKHFLDEDRIEWVDENILFILTVK